MAFYIQLYLTIMLNSNISLEIKPFLYDFITICKTENCPINMLSNFSKMNTTIIPEHFEDPVFMQCNFTSQNLSFKKSEVFSGEYNIQTLIDHELGHCLFRQSHLKAYSNQSNALMETRPPNFYTNNEIDFWTPIWRKNLLRQEGSLLD